jgi:hypothetical protein
MCSGKKKIPTQKTGKKYSISAKKCSRNLAEILK